MTCRSRAKCGQMAYRCLKRGSSVEITEYIFGAGTRVRVCSLQSLQRHALCQCRDECVCSQGQQELQHCIANRGIEADTTRAHRAVRSRNNSKTKHIPPPKIKIGLAANARLCISHDRAHFHSPFPMSVLTVHQWVQKWFNHLDLLGERQCVAS